MAETPASPTPADTAANAEAMELARLAVLAVLAGVFANFGQMELASAALGGALALLRPRGAPGPGALTVGLAAGTATFAIQAMGVI